MHKNPRTKQLPGRVEALRLVIGQGVAKSSHALKQLAGLHVRYHPMRRPLLETLTFSSGVDQLSPEERAAMPF